MEAGAVPRVAPPLVPTLTPRLLRLASDARLVGFVRDGREGAFETIYDRHSRGIYAFCRHMLGDADEAEDAVQHTFMAAYSDLLRSDRPMHLRAWLFTIARNRCFTMLRARREQPSDAIEEAVAEGVAAQVQRRQDLRDLVDDMRRLPDEQRAALVLAEIDALTHAEIAEVLSVPREKVKALVFQARESLVASRNARDTACSEIREQLAVGRGASLRRANLRRHLRECDGCRAFRAQVQQQRKQFALLLPVGPTLAVKEALFGASAAGGGAAAIGTGVLASGAIKSGVAKGLVGAVLTAIGTAGGVVVATTSHMHLQSLLDEVSGALSAPARTAGHAGRVDRTVTSTRSSAHAAVTSSTASGARVVATGTGAAALGLGSWAGGAGATHSATATSLLSNRWNGARHSRVGGRRSSLGVHRILHSRSTAAPAPVAPSAPAASAPAPSAPAIPIVHGRQQASGSDSQTAPGASGSSPGHSPFHGRGNDSTGSPGSAGSAGSDSGSPAGSAGAASSDGNGGDASGNSGNAPGHAPASTGAAPSSDPAPAPGPDQGAPGNSPGQTGGPSGNGAVQTQQAPGNSGSASGHSGPQGNGADAGSGQGGPGSAGHGHGNG